MPDLSCDVAVVGAGIIGTSIAYHLAARGLTDVVVVEREIAPGMGSTAKAAGGIRAQFGSAINVELSRLSIEAFERFPREIGVPVVFNQVGYLWIATKPDEMRLFRENAALQQSRGLDVKVLTRDEVGAHAPYVRLDDVLGGTFHGKDGYAPPADYVMGYHKASKERGVRYLFGADVTAIDGSTLKTSQGAVRARRIVCAAGAFSGLFGKMIGVDVPVQPVRRQCFVTKPIREGLPHPIPMTVDYTSGVYIHSESGGVLAGKADKYEPVSFNTHTDPAFIEHIAECAMHRIPLLENAEILTAWGGLYEVTPDHHPILDELPTRPGVFLASGFSGHGVMHAPATGQLMAEWLIDGKPSLDLRPLRWSRFQERDLIPESHVI